MSTKLERAKMFLVARLAMRKWVELPDLVAAAESIAESVRDAPLASESIEGYSRSWHPDTLSQLPLVKAVISKYFYDQRPLKEAGAFDVDD